MNKPAVFLLLFVFVMLQASGQHRFAAIIKDSITHEAIPGATALLLNNTSGGVSNENGALLIAEIPEGIQTINFRATGYNTKTLSFNFPMQDSIALIFLSPTAEVLHEVIVEATRGNKTISNIPTRVEVLTDEIEEASAMDPSKIAHLLTHSTGIQVQQTSATSNTANVRIQGLDGRYTQILKDGFPLYGGFSGSLSIMQIPPLDLRQVEYIKGGASTLYGGGAISGLINLISKEPNKKESLIHLNASHIGALDLNSFFSRRFGKVGFTLLAQRNTHKYFDADDDGFSDMPELEKYNINPRLFFYFNEKTKLTLGGTFTDEKRRGGDTKILNGKISDSAHFYLETNDVSRMTTQMRLDHTFSTQSSVAIRNSVNIFNRSLSITSAPFDHYRFAGKQISTFSEIAYTFRKKENVFIAGLNLYSDDFKEDSLQSSILRNESYTTAGAFVNYLFDLNRKISAEAGFRGDYVFGKSFYALPRLSVLFKWTDKLITRVGGGMGYRNPTIFNQEAELYGYKNVLPVNSELHAERSYGGNADIGYKTAIGDHFFLNVNQMFFYTRLQDPLVFGSSLIHGMYNYSNAKGHTESFGAETFFKLSYRELTFFAGYTYTNATNYFTTSTFLLPLTPQHSLKGDLLYTLPEKWRIGADYEYKSSQTLSNGSKTPSFWTFGVLVEYTWRQFSVYANVENITNVRQTNFGSLRSAPYDTPQFTEVWAPLDGRVFNAGCKLRL